MQGTVVRHWQSRTHTAGRVCAWNSCQRTGQCTLSAALASASDLRSASGAAPPAATERSRFSVSFNTRDASTCGSCGWPNHASAFARANSGLPDGPQW